MVFINRISPSKFSTLMECEFKFGKKYVDKLPEVFNDNSSHNAMTFGSYIHKVLEAGYKCNSLEELKTIAESEKPNYKFTKYSEAYIEKILVNFLKFNKNLAETVDTEFSFEVPVNEGLIMNGIIDRVVRATDGSLLVIDYKTSKSAKSSFQLMSDPQALMYVFAMAKLYGVEFSKIMFIHFYPNLDLIVPIKFNGLQVQNFLASKLVKKINEVRRKKKEELRTQINNFCNFCGMKGICPAWNTPQEITENLKSKQVLIEAYRKKPREETKKVNKIIPL